MRAPPSSHWCFCADGRVVWTIALTRPAKVHEAKSVTHPHKGRVAPAQLGEQASRTAMTDVSPAKLSATKVRVLNASGRGGQAAEVAGAMKDLGFATPTAANDPLYAGAR